MIRLGVAKKKETTKCNKITVPGAITKTSDVADVEKMLEGMKIAQ